MKQCAYSPEIFVDKLLSVLRNGGVQICVGPGSESKDGVFLCSKNLSSFFLFCICV